MWRILLIAVLLAGAPASAAVQSGGQQSCVNTANGAAKKLATAFAKEASRCVKKAGQGREQDAAGCLESSSGVARARASLASRPPASESVHPPRASATAKPSQSR